MANYVWQHSLKGEPERLKMMSDILDGSSRYHLERTGVSSGWRCFEIGAGDGSLSQWLAGRVGPNGVAIATDIRTDLMSGLAAPNLEIRQFDVVTQEPPDAPFDLVFVRALLHHLPTRREVVRKMIRWLKPGGFVLIQEPDFYPTWTVEPSTQREFWQEFVSWAATHQIDYYLGRKVAPWLAEDGMANIEAEGHVGVYNGGSEYAQWWISSIAEVADALEKEGGIAAETIDEFMRVNQDSTYWTMSIAFTAVTAKKVEG